MKSGHAVYTFSIHSSDPASLDSDFFFVRQKKTAQTIFGMLNGYTRLRFEASADIPVYF